jgi:hypothetical protein
MPMRERKSIVIAKNCESAIFMSELHDPLRIGPFSYQIPRENQTVALGIATLAQKKPQLLGAAMNITNHDGPLHRSRPS